MLNHFRTILCYYRPFALWSFIITFMISIICPMIIILISIKLFFTILLLLLLKDNRVRYKLKYYKVVGLPNIVLFGALYILDCFITIPFLLVIKNFN